MGLRAARISLTSPKSNISITLFPMVHAAEAAFFQEVYADAFAHDVVLTEGVSSPVSSHITRAYRWAVTSKRLGLTLQPRLPPPATIKARVIHADVSGDEFGVAWRRVPRSMRWFFYLASPVMGLWLGWFGNREWIGKQIAMDDQPSLDEAMQWSPERDSLDEALLDTRDARLVERLDAELNELNGPVRSVAIVWGAAHVRAVLRAVTNRRRGYFAGRTTWLTVFAP